MQRPQGILVLSFNDFLTFTRYGNPRIIYDGIAINDQIRKLRTDFNNSTSGLLICEPCFENMFTIQFIWKCFQKNGFLFKRFEIFCWNFEYSKGRKKIHSDYYQKVRNLRSAPFSSWVAGSWVRICASKHQVQRFPNRRELSSPTQIIWQFSRARGVDRDNLSKIEAKVQSRSRYVWKNHPLRYYPVDLWVIIMRRL